MVFDILVRRPAVQFMHPGLFFPKPTLSTLTAANMIWAYWFNKATNESNEAAAMRGVWNKKEGAPNGDIDHLWPYDIATFEENFARFREDTPFLSNIPDFGVNGGCFFTVARTQDANIIGGGTNLGFIHGNYGGNGNKGFGFEIGSVPNSTMRVVDYPASGGVLTNQIDMGTSGITDMEKWRIYYGETGRVSGGNKLLAAVNLNPGDGPIPDPGDTTLTGGRAVGSQTWSFGGRIGDTVAMPYAPALHKDISMSFGFGVRPSDDAEQLAFAIQVAGFCTRIGITLGSA